MGLALGLKMPVLRGLKERGGLCLWGPGDQDPCRPRAFTAGGPVECLGRFRTSLDLAPGTQFPGGPAWVPALSGLLLRPGASR